MENVYWNFTPKRQSGRFIASVYEAKRSLLQSGELHILSITEDTYADRMATCLKERCGIEVTIERRTRLEPSFPYKRIYDEFGEILGIYPVPQEKIFNGWVLKYKNNGK